MSAPSSPAVTTSTVRLRRSRRIAAPGKRRVTVVILALVAIWAGLGATEIVLYGTSSAGSAKPASPAPRPTSALEAAAAARAGAASWVARQVSGDAIVSCDPAMCAALQASGVPPARLLLLQPQTADPLGSDVVVATQAVRDQFGARLGSAYAPLVIASFGAGSAQIEVRTVAPDGAAAFEVQLADDRRARIVAGDELLRNTRIHASAAASAVLAAGQADPRLLVTLAALAAERPVVLVSFGDSSPGAASQAVPLRSAEIRAIASAGLPAMLAFLAAQQVPYKPAQVSEIHGPGRQSVLSVVFDAPSPVGLLGGT
jgi:hypothetical protein